MTNLQEIYCSFNVLRSLPIGCIRLRNLKTIEYYENRIKYILPNLLRIIQRQQHGQNIYGDIQFSLLKSIEYLIKDKSSISISGMKNKE